VANHKLTAIQAGGMQAHQDLFGAWRGDIDGALLKYRFVFNGLHPI
jgi:hypothetical protein